VRGVQRVQRGRGGRIEEIEFGHCPLIEFRPETAYGKWHRPALASTMARHFSELKCWHLARCLQREVFQLLKKSVFASNPRARDSLNDAASSARRNIAEGFGRIIECVDNEWLTEKDVAAALTLCKRATVATSRLRKSIKDKPDPPWCL